MVVNAPMLLDRGKNELAQSTEESHFKVVERNDFNVRRCRKVQERGLLNILVCNFFLLVF